MYASRKLIQVFGDEWHQIPYVLSMRKRRTHISSTLVHLQIKQMRWEPSYWIKSTKLALTNIDYVVLVFTQINSGKITNKLGSSETETAK